MWDLVKDLHWLISIPVMLIIALAGYMILNKTWANPVERDWLIGLLQENTGKAIYKRELSRRLEQLDQRLSSDETSRSLSPARIAWSADLATLCLGLAVTYPMLAFLMQWFAGYPLALADIEIAPAGSQQERIICAIWLASSLLIYLFAAKSKSLWRCPLHMLATGILFGGMFLRDLVGVPTTITVTVAIAATIAFTAAFVSAFAGPLTTAFKGVIIAAFAAAGAIALASAFTFAGVFVMASVFAGAFVLAVAHLEDRKAAHPIFRFMPPFLLFVALSIIIKFFWAPETSERFVAYIVLFLGVLPIFNALADFASIGLTRHLLRKGLNSWTFQQAIWVVLGGLAIFALLGCALITYIHLIQPPSGPLFNLSAMFTGLESNPSAYWWLSIIMISTLLPTLAHLILGLATSLLGWSKGLRDWIIARLNAGAAGNNLLGASGAIVLASITVSSLWAVVVVIWAIFQINHAWLLQAMIGCFKAFAQMIGAV